MIDAFAGALGSIGGLTDSGIERNAALIAGTSSCIMGIANDARSVSGIWGPYFGAVLPDKWVWEGGQSATGGLLDHIITLFGEGRKPDAQTHRDITRRVGELRAAEGEGFASDIHVLPDFHGNRSPFANPNAKGIIAGLTLDRSFDNLCRVYWRTALGIALGLRQIVEHLKDHGRQIETLHVVGGHRWNPLLMELYADATGLEVCEPRTGDAVLLGTAMLAAAASGVHGDLATACAVMSPDRSIRRPRGNSGPAYQRDYEMFKSLQKLYCG
jgi:ribulose kinase